MPRLAYCKRALHKAELAAAGRNWSGITRLANGRARAQGLASKILRALQPAAAFCTCSGRLAAASPRATIGASASSLAGSTIHCFLLERSAAGILEEAAMLRRGALSPSAPLLAIWTGECSARLAPMLGSARPLLLMALSSASSMAGEPSGPPP